MKAIRGKDQRIKVGSIVRYIGTGTVGKVKDVKVEDERNWALLDSSDLYYQIMYLENIEAAERPPVGESPLKAKLDRFKELEKAAETIQEKIGESTGEGGG